MVNMYVGGYRVEYSKSNDGRFTVHDVQTEREGLLPVLLTGHVKNCERDRFRRFLDGLLAMSEVLD